MTTASISPGSSSRRPPKSRRGKALKPALISILLVAAALLLWQPWSAGPGAAQAATAETATVRRGELVVTVNESGALRAARAAWITSPVEDAVQILKIVPEGTRVKKDDWLVELDTTSLQNQRDRQLLAVERARSAFEQSRASHNITVTQNESDLAAAQNNLFFAETDLEKFTDPKDGDKEVQILEQQNRIKLAEDELENAKNILDWSEKLYAQDFITETELKRDEIAHTRAELNLQMARARLENLLKFDLVKQEARLKAEVLEATRNLNRVKERCEQRLLQSQTDVDSKKQQLDLEVTQLERIERQIAQANIKAPQDGLVVYFTETGGGRRFTQEPIDQGVTVRYRQRIMSLPDVSKIMVDVSIHESARALVRSGQPASVLVEALEGRSFRGTVTRVPEVPDSSSSWLTPDRKVFKTEIEVLDDTTDVRPGMSARVTIFCERLPDVLLIPLQAVIPLGRDSFYVCVRTPSGPQARLVTIGRHNDKSVQILSGLSEGEEVFLSEPKDAPRPPAPADPVLPEIPESPAQPAIAPDPEGERPARPKPGAMDPAALLERLKETRPELYEQLKDLPPDQVLERMRELGPRRGQRPPGEGGPQGAQQGAGPRRGQRPQAEDAPAGEDR